MGLKAKVEAIIYAAEEPITAEQVAALLKDMVLAEEADERAKAEAAAREAHELSGESTPPDRPLAEVVESASEAAEAEIVEAEAEVAEGEASGEEVPADADAEAHEPAAEFAPVPADPHAPAGVETDAQASVPAPDTTAAKKKKASKKELTEDGRVIVRVRAIIEELITDYQREERGMEIRAVAGGYRMATKPEHHDVVRAFAKSLKPPVKLSLAALETLAVIAYKQPITVPEISEIRGVESGGVIGTLLDRKLITTAGRKQVVGRPILYKTSKEFLMRFGLGGIADLPSMEEFEKLALSDGQAELFTPEAAPKLVESLRAEESADSDSQETEQPEFERANAVQTAEPVGDSQESTEPPNAEQISAEEPAETSESKPE